MKYADVRRETRKIVFTLPGRDGGPWENGWFEERKVRSKEQRFSGSSQVFLFLPSAIISCSYSSSRLPNHPSKSMPHGSWIPAFPATTGPDTIDATPTISPPSRAAPNPTETAWMTFNQPQILLFFTSITMKLAMPFESWAFTATDFDHSIPTSLPYRSCYAQPSATLPQPTPQ